MDRTRKTRRHLRLEALEDRKLLSADAIEAAATRSQFGVDGTGEAAAVIDTGVNYAHEALGGGFGAGFKVMGGVDFADGHATPMATASQHGTAVAGLIASSDATTPGVAPGADIVALRVFGDNGQGSFDHIADALQYVVDNHAKDDITVVNMSISDGGAYTSDVYATDGGVGQRITGLIQQLSDLDIPVIVADGNSYAGKQGIGFPAIDPATINVASLDTTGKLAGDAQRLGATAGGASATTIAAPGTNLLAPAAGNTFMSASGSSFATAEVSGSVLLLQQIYQSRFGHLPSVADLKGWLQAGSNPVPGSGIGVGGLDVLKAAKLIPAAPAPVVTPPPAVTPTTVTPTTVTPTTVTPTAVTPTTPTSELIVDGVSKGAIKAGDTSTVWGQFLFANSSHVNFSQVQVWTSTPTKTKTVGTLVAASAHTHSHPRGQLLHAHLVAARARAQARG